MKRRSRRRERAPSRPPRKRRAGDQAEAKPAGYSRGHRYPGVAATATVRAVLDGAECPAAPEVVLWRVVWRLRGPLEITSWTRLVVHDPAAGELRITLPLRTRLEYSLRTTEPTMQVAWESESSAPKRVFPRTLGTLQAGRALMRDARVTVGAADAAGAGAAWAEGVGLDDGGPAGGASGGGGSGGGSDGGGGKPTVTYSGLTKALVPDALVTVSFTA
jgi:uncharacterized membrane protein YgcG